MPGAENVSRSELGGRNPKGPATQSDLHFRKILRTLEHALGRSRLGIRRSVKNGKEGMNFSRCTWYTHHWVYLVSLPWQMMSPHSAKNAG